MGKLVISMFVALDGVVENPGWTFPYWNDEIAAFKGEESTTADALLLGRVTYDGFAMAWPDSKDEGAERFNSMPKYVVSANLKSADWNNSHIIASNVMEEIAKLKAEQNLLVYGSIKLTHSLMKAGLVDQINIIQYPIIVGKGLTFFGDYDEEFKFKLATSQAFSSGAVALVYTPEG